MKKIECDRCGEIHNPSQSQTIKHGPFDEPIEICPKCWVEFKKWAKI